MLIAHKGTDTVYVLTDKPLKWGELFEAAGIPFTSRGDIMVLPATQKDGKYFAHGKELKDLDWHEA